MTDKLTSQDRSPLNDSIPNEQELDNLGKGCYVQIQAGNSFYWIEITDVNGDVFTGFCHRELDKNTSPSKTELESKLVTFNKNQIINLGCDNYCWC